MKILIETIPHQKQRYETVGDWFWEDQHTLHIKVSGMSDWRREILVAVHELWEVILCKHHKVDQKEVDRFDKQFEDNRLEGNEDEPGDDKDAPYRQEHCSATGVERILAAELDVVWKDYEDELGSL